MNRFFTLLLAASCLTAVGQVEFPWNPDTNDDGIVGAEDLLGLLSVYNGEWELPDPTLWATNTIQNLLSLEQELDSIAQSIENEQVILQNGLQALDSLQQAQACSQLNNGLGDSFGKQYLVYVEASNGQAHQLPTDCRHVTVSVGCGSGVSNPILLPEGSFDGQMLSIFIVPDNGAPYNDMCAMPIVVAFDNGLETSVVHTFTDCHLLNTIVGYVTTASYSCRTKCFVWSNSSWSILDYPLNVVQSYN